jgi:hypothetical protein
MIGVGQGCRGDDQRIWKSQWAMSSPDACCGRGDVDVERDDLDRQSLAEIVDDGDGLLAESGRRDKTLGESGRRHR